MKCSRETLIKLVHDGIYTVLPPKAAPRALCRTGHTFACLVERNPLKHILSLTGIIARQPFQLLTTRRCLLHRHLTDDSEALYKELFVNRSSNNMKGEPVHRSAQHSRSIASLIFIELPAMPLLLCNCRPGLLHNGSQSKATDP